MARPERDIVGQTIGKWKVLNVQPKRSGVPRMCACLCTGCGARKLVKKNHLLAGETSSCGCQTVRDLSGLRSGRLLVLRRSAQKPYPHAGASWDCRCDCDGKIISVPSRKLTRRQPMLSCGCMKKRNREREHHEPVVRCEAYRPGIYNHRRVLPGEVLDVRRSSFCTSWLRRVPSTTPLGTTAETPDEPLRTTGSQAALDHEADVLRPFGVTSASRLHADEEFNDGRAVTLDDFPNHEDNP
jgi:hypothetical protein